jgi:hypothetical protein
MFIQCFIKKYDNSDVFVDFEGVRYIFTRNALGDAVCFVGNQGHQRRLLMMGPGAYNEYPQKKIAELQNQQAGGAPIPLGKHQEARREPEAKEPLPDNMTVDEALADEGQLDDNQVRSETAAEGVARHEAQEAAKKKAAAEEVEWQPEAVKTKINEFQGLNKANFESYVNAHADRIMGWPKVVRSAIARKLNNNFPGQDPGIEGFVINDYLGDDTGHS